MQELCPGSAFHIEWLVGVLKRGRVPWRSHDLVHLGTAIADSSDQKLTTSGSNVLPFMRNRAGDSNARTGQGFVSSLPCSVVRERSDGPVGMTNLR
jgi:hypothetical protein